MSDPEFLSMYGRAGDGPAPGSFDDLDHAAIDLDHAAIAETEDDEETDDEEAEDSDDLDVAAKTRLDEALRQIDVMFGRPPAEQVSTFTEAHRILQSTLARIDTN